MNDPAGQYTLDFVEMEHYLRVTVRADTWTPAMADRYNRELAEKMADVTATRVLIFRDIPVTLRLVALFKLMTDFVDGLGDRRVAVVNPFPELRKDLEFTMEIASHRKADYKLFDNIPDAEAWLTA